MIEKLGQMEDKSGEKRDGNERKYVGGSGKSRKHHTDIIHVQTGTWKLEISLKQPV